MQFSKENEDLEKPPMNNESFYANWFYWIKPNESQDEIHIERVELPRADHVMFPEVQPYNLLRTI